MKLSTKDRKKFRIRNRLKTNNPNNRMRLTVSRSTKNIAEPPQALFFAKPLPNTATYLSLSISPSDDVGILIIFGVDQVSPSFV